MCLKELKAVVHLTLEDPIKGSKRTRASVWNKVNDFKKYIFKNL